jgi:hypothetical protein
MPQDLASLGERRAPTQHVSCQGVSKLMLASVRRINARLLQGESYRSGARLLCFEAADRCTCTQSTDTNSC